MGGIGGGGDGGGGDGGGVAVASAVAMVEVTAEAAAAAAVAAVRVPGTTRHRMQQLTGHVLVVGEPPHDGNIVAGCKPPPGTTVGVVGRVRIVAEVEAAPGIPRREPLLCEAAPSWVCIEH